MPTPEATRRLLEQAATRFGGVEQLAKKLGVSQRLMNDYLNGTTPLPDAVFLRLADLISEWPRPQPPPPKDPKA